MLGLRILKRRRGKMKFIFTCSVCREKMELRDVAKMGEGDTTVECVWCREKEGR
jgi:transcription elongation factor Elf1